MEWSTEEGLPSWKRSSWALKDLDCSCLIRLKGRALQVEAEPVLSHGGGARQWELSSSGWLAGGGDDGTWGLGREAGKACWDHTPVVLGLRTGNCPLPGLGAQKVFGPRFCLSLRLSQPFPGKPPNAHLPSSFSQTGSELCLSPVDSCLSVHPQCRVLWQTHSRCSRHLLNKWLVTKWKSRFHQTQHDCYH